MDIVFDLDGTLADATHRLHWIKQPAEQIRDHVVPDFKPDWDSFLLDEHVARDTPMPQTWHILESLLFDIPENRVIFITGRKETSRNMTYKWLTEPTCPVRAWCSNFWSDRRKSGGAPGPVIYMRSNDDRRPSEVAKRDALNRARLDGYDPKLAFEDRKTDTAMWRSEGLLCCQVAEGNY